MKKTIKLLLILILAVIFVLTAFAFAACNNANEPTQSGNDNPSQSGNDNPNQSGNDNPNQDEDNPTKYTVTANANGGIGNGEFTVNSDGTLIPPQTKPMRDGYFFVGWYKDANCTNEWDFATDKVTADITLYAKWIEVITGTQGLEFTPNSGGKSYSVSRIGTATDEKIVIPSVYNNKLVTKIGDSSFQYCSSITSIVIPNSVTTIGNYAFSYCENLTSVTIPNSVTTIGDALFQNCSKLNSVTISNSVTTIGIAAFWNCNSITSVTIPNSVTSIGEGAFYNCSSLTNIVIPDSVTTIGSVAFDSCNNLQYNEYNNALYLGNTDNPYAVLMKTKFSDVTSYTISENTKVIYDAAFYQCSSLTSIAIPNSVTSIGESAFKNCSSLTEIKFNGTVAQWNVIDKGFCWSDNILAGKVICSDGDVKL